MRVVMFAHSFLSDWNNGSAQFLRGVVTELVSRGHEVVCYEPRNAASVESLLREKGAHPVEAVTRIYPALDVVRYVESTIDLDIALTGAALVLVHCSCAPEMVAALGKKRADRTQMRMLFHDTSPGGAVDVDLTHYDGVLAFADSLRAMYVDRARAAWTWREAADTRLFKPLLVRTETTEPLKRDLVWIGNWDEQRAAVLKELLIEPCQQLGLDADVYGVGYPEDVLADFTSAGIHYHGWLGNYYMPETFQRFCCTVNIPRPQSLPGVPATRVFEALACGIPLISGPWDDSEGLFTPGKDFLVAQDARDMVRLLRDVLSDVDMAISLSNHGMETIQARHTCAHRVDELLLIYDELGFGELARSATARPARFR